MASNVMKMAFVINGALNPNFTTSIGRAKKQIDNLNKYVEKLQNQQLAQNIDFTNGGKSLKQFDRNTERLSAEIERSIAKRDKLETLMANRNVSRLNYNAAKIDFMSTMQSVKVMTAPLYDAYETAANFEKAMSKVGAISLGDVKGEEYNRQLQRLTDTARQLGERTQFTATQSAEAMSYLGMAGWKTNQIIEGMPALLSLAVAGNTDLARTADIVSDNLTAFGLAAKDSIHMADVYATVITNTNTNVEMLGETMKYAAPVAKAFGASLEETAAMAGLMANAGIKASQAGTSIRGGLLRLAGPPKAAATELEKLGISISDVSKEQAESAAMLKSLGVDTGTLEGSEKMASILSQLREKFKDMSENEKVAAGNAIFGRNAVTGWLSMLDAEEGAFEKLVQQLRNCDGAAAQMEKRMNANAKGAATRLKSAWESLQISMMNGFLPTIASALDKVAQFTGAFSRFVSENPMVAKVLVGLALGITGVVTALASFGMATAAIKYGIDGFLFWKQTIKGCEIASTLFGKSLTMLSKASYFFSVATKAVSAALVGLPIGWVILGIAALVVAGTMLYKHWDKVKTFFTELWESPKARLLMFVTGPIGWLIGAVTAIIANWDTLKAYFEYFWENPGAALFRFQNWVQDSFQNAVKAGEQKWNELKAWLDKPIFATFIAPAWDKLTSAAAEAFESVKAWAGETFDGIKTRISNAIDSAINTVLNLPQTISYAIGYAAGFLYETLTQLPGKVLSIVTAAGDFLSNLPQACYEAGVNFINRLGAWGAKAYTSLSDSLGRMVDNAKEFLSGIPDACYQAGAAFLNRLTTWSSEAFGELVSFLIELDKACWKFLWNLPTICMDAGRKFVSAAAQWAQDAYNSIMEWIMKLPEAISNTISNAWENIKSKFSGGFTVGVSAAAQNAAPVAENAKGGIYNRGAFLTTFAEKSPEAAIPIDNSDRAKGLWLRVGRMLGMVQQPKGRTTTSVFRLSGTAHAQPSGYEPTRVMPDLSGIFGAVLKKIRMPKPERAETKIPDISIPSFPEQPTPIVNTKTVLPELAPIFSPIIRAIAPAVTPIVTALATAPDVNVDSPAAPVVNAMAAVPKLTPIFKPILKAVAPVINPVINAMAKTPDVNVASPAAPIVNAPTSAPIVNAMTPPPIVNPADVNVPKMDGPVLSPVLQAMAATPEVSPIFSTSLDVPEAEAPQVQVSPSIQALAKTPAVTAMFDPLVQPAAMPDINVPQSTNKETLIERVRDFVREKEKPQAAAPSIVFRPNITISGNADQKEVERAMDISFERFRELMNRFQAEQRRVRYE